MKRSLQCPSENWAQWIPTSVKLAAALASHQNILTAGICLVQECASNKQGAHLHLLGLLNITSGALFWTNSHFSAALLAQAQWRRLSVTVGRPQKCCTQGMKEAHRGEGTLNWSDVQGLSHRKWHLWVESLLCQKIPLLATPRPCSFVCQLGRSPGPASSRSLPSSEGAPMGEPAHPLPSHLQKMFTDIFWNIW